MKNLFAKEMVITDSELENVVGGRVEYDDGRKKRKEEVVYRYSVGEIVEVYDTSLGVGTTRAIIVEHLPPEKEGLFIRYYVPVYRVKFLDGWDAGDTREYHQSWIECHEL